MKNSKPDVYPPQTGAYLVKVKTGQSWKEYKTARLQISVGMPYHESDKFIATINWVKDRFEKVIICVNDTLQRYNLMYENDLNESDAKFKTMEMGRQWISRNLSSISLLNEPILYRWEEWIQNPEYEINLQKVENLYASNQEFREAVEKNIEEFWIRRQKNPTYQISNKSRFFALSRRYLLEETAVFSMMFSENKAVDVYPGTTLLPVTIFKGRQVQGAPAGLGMGSFTRIDFNRSPHLGHSNSNQTAA